MIQMNGFKQSFRWHELKWFKLNVYFRTGQEIGMFSCAIQARKNKSKGGNEEMLGKNENNCT
jgi:hypothetical protein